MAWRVCIVPGCPKTKLIQPFNTNTKHRWLCPRHRAELREETISRITRVAKAKRSLASIMNSRESLD